ncbi:hypothetical protein DFQ26_008655 [Actinomortierella ambigua]|nr:hypothetical protein DFQ26_008655 [Actinomortierella ambigua]
MFTRQGPLDDDEPLLLPLVSQPCMKDATHLEDPNMSIGSNTSTGCASSTSTVVASSSSSTPLKGGDGFGLDLGVNDVAVSTSPKAEAGDQNERRPSIALSICSSAHSDEDDVPTPEAIREAARDKRRLKLAIALHDRDGSCRADEHDMEPLAKFNAQGENEVMLHREDDDEEEEDGTPQVAHKHTNLNITAATLHVLGDLLSSIGVLISSLLITFFPAWTILDPICTFVFSILVILTTIGVFKRSVAILMERVPNHLSVEETREAIRTVPGVLEVKRIHLWALTLGQTALTARVYLQPDIQDTVRAAKVIRATRRLLRRQYGIRQSTIQFEMLQDMACQPSSKQLGQQCLKDEDPSNSTSSSSSSSHDHYHHHHQHHSHSRNGSHSHRHNHTHSHHHRGPSDGRAPERHDADIIFSVGEDEDHDDTIRHTT